jgi:hypothetical protein
MKQRTKTLTAGQVMASGEVVVSATASKPYMVVKLFNPKRKTERTAQWNLNGTVFVRAEELEFSPTGEILVD